MKTITYQDPSQTESFGSTPYEAAHATAQQAIEIITLAQLAVHDTNIQARNAWMQRNLDTGKPPNGSEWENHPEAKSIQAAYQSLVDCAKKMTFIQSAAAYDPKAPIPK